MVYMTGRASHRDSVYERSLMHFNQDSPSKRKRLGKENSKFELLRAKLQNCKISKLKHWLGLNKHRS